MGGFGTGSPIWFHCPKWRARSSFLHLRGPVHEVTLTGRTRAERNKKGHARGPRHGAIAREFRCLTCGHVGWSRHTQLARMAGGEPREGEEP